MPACRASATSLSRKPVQETQLSHVQEPAQANAETALNGGPQEAAVQAGAPMIVFEGVTKVYDPNIVALRDASFVIEKGEFVFLVGPSGSGKSTIMRLLLKELDPTSGRIIVGGRELARLKNSKVPMLRRNIGCVFQDFKLLTNRTASENVSYALKVQGESKPSSGSPARRTRSPTSCPAVSSSASQSHAPSSTIHR
jgi:ABC-type multidrug transport system fused ATPase/permease subunit